METEQITQVIEAIKTLNFNINSQSMVEIVKTLKPLLMWILVIRPLITNVLWICVIFGLVYVAYRGARWLTVGSHVEECKEENCRVCEKWKV